MGNKAREDGLPSYFEEWMRDHALVDVVLDPFGPTWRNGRTGREGIAKNIDQFLVCQSLFLHLSKLEFSILTTSILDHKPIMLAWRGDFDNRAYPFKFNPRWLQMNDFKQLVHLVWMRPLHSGSMDCLSVISNKISRLKREACEWIAGKKRE